MAEASDKLDGTAGAPWRRIGRGPLALPRFGLGGAHLGDLSFQVPEVQARGALEAAWNGGVRYYDTAPWYGNGLSEHRFGGLLRTKPRDEFRISTKVGRVYSAPKDPASFTSAPWAGGLPFELTFDYGYDGVMRSFEQSMLRLGLSKLDALAIHDLDRGYHDRPTFKTHWRALEKGGLKALEALKKAGDIGAIGAGINDTEMLERFATRLDLDYLLVAMPYTLLDQAPARAGGAFELCAKKNISVIIGAPFASGVLADPKKNKSYNYGQAAPEVMAKVGRLQVAAKKHGVALPAAAIQFVLAHPVVASVIPGVVSARQARENLGHLTYPIPADFWAELKAEGLIDPEAPVPSPVKAKS